jgi:arylsulfatase
VTNNDQLDVLIAVYLIPELAQQDYEKFVEFASDGTISTDGVVLVTKDADGDVAVKETGDHMGRRGVKAGGGVGLVVGLFAPPLLATTVVGAAAGGIVGKVARKRVTAGIGEKMDDALPPGTAGIISVYDHDDAEVAAGALVNAIRSSIAQIDKASAKELKEGLEQASAGLAG